MKIAHVFKDYYPPLAAGITRYMADIADGMAIRGHDVQVHVAGVHHARRDRLPSGVVVHRHRELCRALSMPIAPGLISEVRALDVDILHVHLPNPIGEIGSVLNGRAAIVCTFHAQLGRQQALEPLYAPLRNRLLARAQCVLVSGTAMAETTEMSLYQDKLRILPYGVSPRLIATSKGSGRKNAARIELLFVGRLVYYKGLDYLLRAVAVTRHTRLTIVGDGPQRVDLEGLRGELGIRDRVSFQGLVTDKQLRDIYSNSDVFILPSISPAESFGMAMSEAMANGIPAISTALGTGTDWVNVDRVTGIVVPPRDVTALAHAIDELADPNYRAFLGNGAVSRALSQFSLDRHLDALEDVYEVAAS